VTRHLHTCQKPEAEQLDSALAYVQINGFTGITAYPDMSEKNDENVYLSERRRNFNKIRNILNNQQVITPEFVSDALGKLCYPTTVQARV